MIKRTLTAFALLLVFGLAPVAAQVSTSWTVAVAGNPLDEVDGINDVSFGTSASFSYVSAGPVTASASVGYSKHWQHAEGALSETGDEFAVFPVALSAGVVERVSVSAGIGYHILSESDKPGESGALEDGPTHSWIAVDAGASVRIIDGVSAFGGVSYPLEEAAGLDDASFVAGLTIG